MREGRMTMRDSAALRGEGGGGGGDSGDELHIVLRHQTNSPLQDSLQPAWLETGTNWKYFQ